MAAGLFSRHSVVIERKRGVLVPRRSEALCLDTGGESEHRGARPRPNPGAAQIACLF